MKNITGRLFLILSMLFLTSCLTLTSHNRSSCPKKSSSIYYFSKGFFNPSGDYLDTLYRDWYSKQLRAMSEPSLSCGSPQESYRFTWLRSFHHPVMVRVTLAEQGAVLQAVELDGAGGYEPGKVLRRTQRAMTNEESIRLKSLMSQSQFTNLSRTEPQEGTDGADWIIESTNGNSYHLVVRWSPQDGPVRTLGDYFLKLTGWKFDDVY